jgi:ABC-type amino acid transport substrate-binding protein
VSSADNVVDKSIATRDSRGRWVKGSTSPNPSGASATVREIRDAVRPHLPALIAKTVELALAGDSGALKILIDRAAPAPRSAYEPVQIEGLAEAEGLVAKAECIVAAVGTGTISADIGERLLGALAALAKLIETEELADRIAALEQGRVLHDSAV